MTIRTKILSGCLAMMLLTFGLGVYGLFAQRQLGDLALGVFDEGLMGVSYLRSAEVGFVGLASGLFTTETAPDVLDDLAIARDRAMSSAGHDQAEALRGLVGVALADPAALGHLQPERLIELQGKFEQLVETFSADGFHYRRNMQQLIARHLNETLVAMSGAVLAALIITAIVNHGITPPIRRAVGLAMAIADGKLDNAIALRGSGEPAQLLRALSAMQASIAGALQRIKQLMAEQASTHAGQLAKEHARLAAALDNMNQGLCLFEADGRLGVANRRFAELFGEPQLGAAPGEVLQGETLAGLARGLAGGQQATFAAELIDGRVIAVAQQPIDGGGWVTTYDDITERRQSEQRLVHMARHDVLTGLPNRLLFSEFMPQAIARGRRAGGVAVFCLDLDRFKAVNDTLGHAAGDALLCAVAERIRATTRKSDLIVRMGGDEFAIVQEGGDQPAEATSLATRLIKSLEAPFLIDDQQVVIGLSIGIALSSDGLSAPEAMLKCADLALYRAKAEGRGVFRFFEAEMDARMQARRAMELDLRKALALDQFEVFYQPLVSSGSGAVTGFEALLRWRHPSRGLVSPALFVPVAEEIGIIAAVGTWVLHRACSDAASWDEPLKVAVNLSPEQFRSRALVDDVADALRQSGLPANRLELEITESTLIQDDEAVLEILHALRAHGVRISMDDFGTGYSSLGYLRRFPFDKIKIDQSFVRGMMEEGDCLAIVRAVIGLGRSLGISVNAEGVETAEQMATLRDEGCGELQGYLFSKPRPQSDVEAMMGARQKAVAEA